MSAPGKSAIEAYQRYAPALIRKAERILRNGDDAADLVQALFVELVHRDARGLELPYLYRAVTNRCLNFLRDAGARRRLLDRQEAALAPPARVRCDDRAIGLDMLVKLTRCLDDKHLEVLVCRYVDDMTQDEIAEHLKTSRKTIGKRLQLIRARVAELGDAPPEPRSSRGGEEART